MDEVIEKYLACLESGNYEQLIKLFASAAIVSSPLYGKKNAEDFYKVLFSDTNASKINLLNLFTDKDSHKAAVHFNYEWTLKDGVAAPFEVVDIIEFDDKMKITSLKIIYDTQQTREKFNIATER